MNKALSAKNIIIGFVVIIVIGIVYFYFEGGVTPITASLLQSQDIGTDVGSAELTLLNQIQSLKIDTSLFTLPAYATLLDYSVAIPPENVGRPNPFAPLPGESASGSDATSVGTAASAPAAPSPSQGIGGQ